VDFFARKIRRLRLGFFLFVSCASCSGIGLSMYFTFTIVLYCSWSVRGRLVGNFPPSSPEDAAYWPDTQRTPPAKEGTNGIWPAISQFLEESWVLSHAPKLGHGTLFYTPSEGRHAVDFSSRNNPTASVGSEPAILGTRGQHANH
jgi:hypothetical protein